MSLLTSHFVWKSYRPAIKYRKPAQICGCGALAEWKACEISDVTTNSKTFYVCSPCKERIVQKRRETPRHYKTYSRRGNVRELGAFVPLWRFDPPSYSFNQTHSPVGRIVMAQYLRFPTPDPDIFEPAFLSDASPETQQRFRGWAFTLKAFGLSDQSIRQVLHVMQLAYFRGRLDELAAQKDHMVTALMEVKQ